MTPLPRSEDEMVSGVPQERTARHILAVECGGPGAAQTAPVLPDNLCGGAEMANRICSVDGCEGKARTRGWCAKHYNRWLKTGSPLTVRPGGSPKGTRRPGSLYCPTEDLCERGDLDNWCDTFRAVVMDYLGMTAQHVAPPDDPLARPVKEPCWVGVGSPTDKGYRLKMIGAKSRRLNRVALAARGVMVDGRSVDHLCRRRECVCPWHLEAVEVGENTIRGQLGQHKTHCIRGHAMTEENIYRYTDPRFGSPKRACLTCRRERDRRRKR